MRIAKRWIMILVIFGSVFQINLKAQEGEKGNMPLNSFSEMVFLHADRVLYACGETVWFKINVFNPATGKLSDLSKIGYIDMVDQRGNAVSRLKLDLNNGQGFGNIELPFSMNSGNYYLRAYTRNMRNKPERDFGYFRLIIINPGQSIVRSKKTELTLQQKVFQSDRKVTNQYFENDLKIEIVASSDHIKQRELSVLDVLITDQNNQARQSEFSISVALKPPVESNYRQPAIIESADEQIEFSDQREPREYLPEIDGMNLTGVVIDRSTQRGLPEVQVYLAFPGKTALVYMATSDSRGHFTFVLPKIYGQREVVIQTRNQDQLTSEIVLDKEFQEADLTFSDSFVLDSKWETYANAIAVNAQIQQAYDAFSESPVYREQDAYAQISIYGQPDFKYVLDDYTRFPIPEFLYEVVPSVRVLGKYRNESLRVSNDWSDLQGAPFPLLLVDGVPVFDEKSFLNINNRLIASAEVVVDPFWLNPEIFDGVIHLISFEEDARCFELDESALRQTYLALQPKRQFTAPDYERDRLSTLPDFRNTLYWNPSVLTDEEGRARISFFTSDHIGEYEITIKAISENGITGSTSDILHVTESRLPAKMK